jgi:oligopeptide/dipeptide ABC transporter ATP-binding protein
VIYAGCLVEVAPTADLFRAPAHPYTEALLATLAGVEAAAPSAGPPGAGSTGSSGGSDGLMPVLTAPPRACPYRSRCPQRLGACDEAMPSLRAVGPTHAVACHLYLPSAYLPSASGASSPGLPAPSPGAARA